MSWENFDSSPTLRLQRLPVLGGLFRSTVRPLFPSGVRYGDIVRGLPIDDASCDGAYCSHILEHLALADLRVALKNTLRVLKPSGIFRLVVPDMEAMTRAYISAQDAGAVSRLMRETFLGTPERPKGLLPLLRKAIGGSHHLWMWDYKGLAAELDAAGFSDIRRASFGDGSLPAFRDVEDSGRWEGSLGVEAKRPTAG